MSYPENAAPSPASRNWQQILLVSLMGLIVFWFSWKFLIPVLMGAAITVVLKPMAHWLERKGWRISLASLVVTLGTLLVVMLPATFLIVAGTKAGMKQLKNWKESPFTQSAPGGGRDFVDSLMKSPTISGAVNKVAETLNVDVEEAVATAGDVAKNVGLKVADALGGVVGQLPALALSLFLVIVSMYFFMIDGDKFTAFIRRNSVFDPISTEDLIKSFAGICRSTLLASVASGVVQALCFLLGMRIAGVEGMMFITLLVFLTSFVPVIGAGPVTIGVAIYYMATSDSTGLSVVLLIFAILTGVVDNFVRPFVLRKGGVELHPLLTFIGLFGGVEVFGFYGLFLGPIFVEMFVAMLMALIRANNRGTAV